MPSGRSWALIAAGSVAVLLIGRWLAGITAERLWADAQGAAVTLAHLRRLRTMLGATGLLAATVWAIGNLFLVYRSIGSIQLPRRLGDLVIVEVVSRRYLLAGAVALGVVLGIALGHGAADWWYVRALAGVRTPVGLVDPVLGRDVSRYLFRLPWDLTVHEFATTLVAVLLVVAVALYTALGAIRWHAQRLKVTDLARWHVAGLLLALAGMLFWGYRLEPAEYLAGTQAVPLDTVLTAVRFPVARLLSGLALLAGVGSVAWMWLPRLVLVALPWLALFVVSLVGHYVVPPFAGASRPAEARELAGVRRQREAFLALAYGGIDRQIPLLGPAEPAARVELEAALAPGLAWDEFVMGLALHRVSAANQARPSDPSLGVYPGSSDTPTPLYVAPRHPEPPAAAEADRLTWSRVHAGPLAFPRGAIAAAGHRAASDGSVLYAARVERPDSLATTPADIPLRDPAIRFGGQPAPFAVLRDDSEGVRGVRAGGFWRRLALAWVLQSPQLLSAERVQPGSLILWRRGAIERLEAYAPFARFGRPRGVVAEQRLYWIASGYVAASAFPVVPGVRWRERVVRYLRAGFVGVVDAATGETAVYLVRNSDPLSLAWADLAPAIVRRADELPAGLEAHLAYPIELLPVQTAVYGGMLPVGSLPPTAGRGEERGSYWWVGALPADATVRLRRLAAVENRETGALAAVLDGTIRGGRIVLDLYRPGSPTPLPGPSQAERRLAAEGAESGGIAGVLRLVPAADGVLAVRATYQSASDSSLPRLVDVGVEWAGTASHGPSLATAIMGFGAPGSGDGTAWSRAREWFARLDAARVRGDWVAFGRAYEELRRLLGGTSDSLR